MGKKFDFDYIIIGSGPAGSTVALNLAKAKKHVALVEGNEFGGSNINTRDIPYGVGLGFSHTFSKLSNYPEINRQSLHYNFPSVASHTERVVTALGGKSTAPFETAGITCIKGYAHFLDNHTIAVGDEQYSAKEFIIATGCRLKASEISGLETAKCLTPETAIKIRRLPRAAFIIGGGPSGCEIAEYYAELGVKVLIMELKDRLLPREDEEAGATLKDYFEKELGMMVCLNSKVVAVEPNGLAKRITFITNGRERAVNADCVVLATGAEPFLNFGLENAGVKYKRAGIMVNKFFQTTAKNIYAVGDCLGKNSSTERAEYEASILVANLLGRSKNFAAYTGFIRKTDTYPEVATVGLNEVDLLKRDRKYKKSIVYLKDLPARQIERMEYGFVKILADKHSDRILGATIVAPNAGYMAEEFSIALRHRLNALALASTPHVANNFSYAIKIAAKSLIK
ncbi:NAD(P)/FAD-dependent oxidoreductase [Candidatus Saccharibacteria bacterium]|nr:NAD(P)/FAD-dependent oxidoreductase [Candidatus Saccharibacteria bacterium]